MLQDREADTWVKKRGAALQAEGTAEPKPRAGKTLVSVRAGARPRARSGRREVGQGRGERPGSHSYVEHWPLCGELEENAQFPPLLPDAMGYGKIHCPGFCNFKNINIHTIEVV